VSTQPAHPKVFHITHVDNLARIVQEGVVWSDAKRVELGLECAIVGMTEIKRRRMEEIVVLCHPGTKVGQYVPFYFCPRSIMLFLLHKGNHPDLDYHQGQEPIIHLQADLRQIVDWADRNRSRWAFSDRNAGARLALFYKKVADLEKINWEAIASTDFKDMVVKEGKQAEFLVFGSFPWILVEKIGVVNARIQAMVDSALANAVHKPLVTVEGNWYY
jgi:hypothetical protein